ncbi:MAG TPA: metalloregulator ArsR/SmtB family transcription factor, partial [Thermoanaerobaculia bacterium]|nr:metalloregulator ArsR/SmtB family transcription factor [Thermoanaerobaculia bacterium]
VFSDGTRLRLLNLMREGEVCVCFFIDVLGQPQPTISRHLAYLREAGLVSARRNGKWMTYSLTPPDGGTARRVFDSVMEAMKDDRAMRRDRLALAKSCCAPRFRHAPKPVSSRA